MRTAPDTWKMSAVAQWRCSNCGLTQPPSLVEKGLCINRVANKRPAMGRSRAVCGIVHRKVVRRLLDQHYGSKLPRIAKTIRVLGQRLVIGV